MAALSCGSDDGPDREASPADVSKVRATVQRYVTAVLERDYGQACALMDRTLREFTATEHPDFRTCEDAARHLLGGDPRERRRFAKFRARSVRVIGNHARAESGDGGQIHLARVRGRWLIHLTNYVDYVGV